MEGKCVLQPEPAGKPLEIQNPGDCKETQCDGDGVTVEVAADDPVIDNNPCLTHSCDAGVPVDIPVDGGTACGDGVCDGAGSCVGCVVASSCLGTDDECKVRTCVTNTCGLDYTPNGTPVSGQTSGNCKQQQCDGSGNVKSVADNSDLPADDGNQCTGETCTGGVPAHPNKPYGTSCNQGGNQCNGSGVCKYTNGSGCSTSSQCLSGYCVDGRCCSSACTGMCQACSEDLSQAADGTCGYIDAAGHDANPLCTGANACNGSGVCQQKGCTFYVDSSYSGASHWVPANPNTYEADLGAIGFGDKLSSHICKGGAQVTLWQHDHQGGWYYTLSGSIPSYAPAIYGELDDNASSLYVF